ncbi:LTA synthase family protein [Bacillus sonorensis]|uniref:LTA synthase family protein n=1 Tax=Bacillus sonorensis TaxID=119858 RepID=UPI00227EA3BB|nr:LTA synthase family protein [Bacillus sonorensis]MCZ0068751.1 LTA synthase family protein [Bacillus sonorensis]MCZ0095145.1 LTA synthase family protein [Bacillus sonorensis]MEC1437949.1 LTA synthase family protein [Bacillus sonorensis]MEC1518276.1 LTA synthase family protein [Bacillus sonorensis]
MKEHFFKKQWFLCLSIFFMWMKTYFIYKLGFHLQIDNALQELILFLNPLSFLIPVFGISLFCREKTKRLFLIAANVILTGILIANCIFYGFYIDFITIPVLFQAKNLGGLGSSFQELFNPLFIVLFFDLALLAWLAKRRKTEVKPSRKAIKLYYTAAAGIALFNLALSELDQPKLLANSFDREVLVKHIGLYQFHLFDGITQTFNLTQKAVADENSLATIENYTNADYSKPNKEMFGTAKGRNVIFVTLESTQSFVIDEKVNGKEITPFLNQFIKKSYYFDHFYQQTEQGKTSDSEFIVTNSLYPSLSGAVFFTKSENQYNSIYKTLSKNDYTSAVFHANNKKFWNRDVMYGSLGIDRFYDVDNFNVTDDNSTGWGLKDKEFLAQSADIMKELPQPFYSSLITLTNHFPFQIDDKDRLIDEYDSNSEVLNRYVTTVRYQDEALKHFIAKLKENGLYEHSVIVFMGDHYGISEAHNDALAQFLGKSEITPYDTVQLQRVPLIIHIPGITDKKPQTISEIGGQIDVKPTLLHLLGVDTKGMIQFGNDLFSNERMPFAVLRNGSFITNDYLYTKNACYNQKTGELLEDAKDKCGSLKEKANEELSLSDKIINGDLLRFYKK